MEPKEVISNTLIGFAGWLEKGAELLENSFSWLDVYSRPSDKN